MMHSTGVPSLTSTGGQWITRGRIAPFAVVLGCVTLLQGCGDFIGACTRELRVRLSPQDTTVVVGRTFEPGVQLSSCGGREQLEDTFSFVSDDPEVAQVDPTTDRVTAIGAGQTWVRVIGERYGPVGAIRVTVAP